MVLIILIWLFNSAAAASLDLIDVGGLWGTPAGTDATAMWWNPASMSMGDGTRLNAEGAAVIASVDYVRTDPLWGGEAQYNYFGMVPFLGVTSDLGVDGLGVGFAVMAPHGRGGEEETTGSPGRYHLRKGGVQAVYTLLGASYAPIDWLSIGATGGFVWSQYTADLDTEVATALGDALAEGQGVPVTDIYTDTVLEDPDYGANVNLGPLNAFAPTFSVGLRLQPLENLSVNASYQHGATVVHHGDVALHIGCPPQSDSEGRFAAEQAGLCDGELEGHGQLGYLYPSRVQGSIAYQPTQRVWLEVLGGYVFWEQFSDFDIEMSDLKSTNTNLDPDVLETLEHPRQWARDNENSFWLALDTKAEVTPWLLLGARITWDMHAVPDHAVSMNNYDADSLQIGILTAFSPIPQLDIGVSYTHHITMDRDITDSGFSLSMDPAKRQDDRWFYGSTTGAYQSNIDRVALSVRARFGKRP